MNYFYEIICNEKTKTVEFKHIDRPDFLEQMKPSQRQNWKKLNIKRLNGDCVYGYTPTNICQFTKALTETQMVKSLDGYDYCIKVSDYDLNKMISFEKFVKFFSRKCLKDTLRGCKSLLALCEDIRQRKRLDEELREERLNQSVKNF